MNKQFNTVSSFLLVAFFMVGCQSGQIKVRQKNNILTQSGQEAMGFDNQIEGKYWKLIAINGSPVVMSENQQWEVHFILNASEKRVNGFGGCNSFSGSYELKTGLRIKFSQMISTLRACLDVEFNEAALHEVFELTDNYTLSDDRLQLNVGRRAPLAVFEAVYLN